VCNLTERENTMCIFSKFENLEEANANFPGNIIEAPWSIAAKYFKVPHEELLFVENSDMEVFPGYETEGISILEKLEEFNDEIKRDGKVLKTFDTTYGGADLIGLGDERFIRFEETGFQAYYTV